MWWLLVSCAGEGTALWIPSGEITLETDSVNLGPVGLDSSAQTDLILSNTGSTSIEVVLSQDGSAEFEVSLEDTLVAAGGTTRLMLAYMPEDPDGAETSVSLEDVGGSSSVRLQVTGLVDPDADADGYEHELAGGADCDDQDGSIHPDAQEVWYDGYDQDCDGADDDQDGDGYEADSDCDDQDGEVHPDQVDPLDGVDQDCDGLVDEDDIQSGWVALTEIFVVSNWNSSGLHQWVEVYNDSGEPLDLVGWELTSGSGSGWIQDPAPLEPGELGVLCATDEASDNGAVECAGLVDPWPTLTVEADEVHLRVSEATIDEVGWDASWALQAGTAHQLDPLWLDSDSNDLSVAWCPAEQTWTHDDAGTPGTENHACPDSSGQDTGSVGTADD